MLVQVEVPDDVIRAFVQEEVARVLGAREENPWFTSDEAATYLGIARSTLHDLVSEGKLPRLGDRKTRLRFRRSTLDAFVESRRPKG